MPAAKQWGARVGRIASIACLVVAAFFGIRSFSTASIPFRETEVGDAATFMIGTGGDVKTKPIQDVNVGDRIAGRNPIREQVEGMEPDPATWRKISLYLEKGNGLGLWIDLLRPLEWIEEHNAKPGSTIFIDLYEMGAVGDAEVIYLGPCPEIQPGNGTLVTGTFKHQMDENTNVVHLKLEDQLELTEERKMEKVSGTLNGKDS
jgi:hypothetical protein